MTNLALGVARARLGPAAAILDPQNGPAACEENRLTRARQASTAGLPELAIAELISRLGRDERDIGSVGIVRDEDQPEWWTSGELPQAAQGQSIDPHRAHAEYAFRSSGFDSALVVVCDATVADGYTAWMFEDGKATRQDSAGSFPLARAYGVMTEALGFRPARDEHLVEAMARAGRADDRCSSWITVAADGLSISTRLQEVLADACGSSEGLSACRDVAASVQKQLGSALTELLTRLARTSGARRLCLSGGLFFNTHFTTAAAHLDAFDSVFIPAHPGRSGSALGAALAVADDGNRKVGFSAFLGPGYTDAQVKEALENCKLAFDLQREDRVLDTVLRALSRGQLVGWFHGRLEWGPRALGHRTVLADPFSPHVLENLNGYLKKRPSYRSYGVSVPLDRLEELFTVEGRRPPSASPYMQFEYRPRDLDRFRTVLPDGVRTLRVHTVDEGEPRYLRLLRRWGEQSGTPVLVNTSFNGFHEPLVCSPRDAIRVFYGTGLDVLALEDFVLRK